MSEVNKKDEKYYLKALVALSLILICAYHFSWVGSSSFKPEGMKLYAIIKRFFVGVNSSYIPLFFMAFGAILTNSEVNIKNYYKTLKNLIIGYFVARFFSFLIIGLYNHLILWDEVTLLQVINSVFLFEPFHGIDVSHLWVIPTFIGIYMLFPLIQKSIMQDDLILVYIGILPLMAVCVGLNELTSLLRIVPFFNELALVNISQFNPYAGMVGSMMMYFLLGALFHKHREEFNKYSYKNIGLILLFGVFFLFMEWLMNSLIKGGNWDSVFNGYKTIATIIITSSIYILVYKFIHDFDTDEKARHIIDTINNNIYVIFYSHWIIGYTVLTFIHNYVFFQVKGIVMNYIKAILVVFVICFFSEKIKSLFAKIKMKKLKSK